jgi:membrane-associated protease RseP (regulator of RpoE activity)
VSVSDGGPDHADKTMSISGDVGSKIAMPFAGAMFFPVGWGFSPVNYSGVKDLTFWVKGDGRSYWISMFTQGGGPKPAPISFVAGKNWEAHKIPLSAFGTDGHDVTGVFIGGDSGVYQLAISGFRFGTGAALGADLMWMPLIPGSNGKFSTQRLAIGNVTKGSPADAAGLKLGDTIISVSNEKTSNPWRAQALLWQSPLGSMVPIEIVRNDRHQILNVKLSEHP